MPPAAAPSSHPASVMRRLLPILAGVLALLPAVQAHTLPQDDSHVSAEVFARQVGDRLRVAIEVAVDEGWHIYHSDLGPEDAMGIPTMVALEAANVSEWGELRFPEPVKHETPLLGTWSWTHHGTVVLRVEGKIAGGEPGTVRGRLEGLICEDKDNGVCIGVDEELEEDGEGPDEYFENWDGALATATQTPNAAEKPASGTFGLRPSFLDSDEEQNEADEIDAALYVRTEGDRVEAAIVFEIAEGWHLYHEELGDPKAIAVPTTIELRGEGIEWESPRWPAPKKEQYDGFWVWAHSGTAVVRVSGRVTGEASGIAARVEGQVCEIVCIPIALTLEPAGKGEDRFFAAVVGQAASTTTRPGDAQGASNAPSEAVIVGSQESGGSLLGFILLAIGGGIFALLMPCTYPMIPITISFFTKQAEKRGGNVLPLSLAYGAGIILIFILIGVVIGPVILTFATHPVTNIVIGIAFLFFALVLFGVWTLQPPQFLMGAVGKASMRGGYVGVFLMGAALVVTSFTCTAPFVGSLLSIGATADGGVGRIAIGMGFFGLTMAVPFVFLSLVPGKIQALPQSGEWMHVLKVTLGFVELAAALKFFSNADLVWGWGIISREVFLLLWAGIFVVTAFFLFGKIHLTGERADEIGPGRMVSGLGALLLALYCVHGYRGYEMDTVMTAIAPNYSTRLIGGAAGNGNQGESAAPSAPREHTIVTDDYERARSMAIGRGAPLLINFTGFS